MCLKLMLLTIEMIGPYLAVIVSHKCWFSTYDKNILKNNQIHRHSRAEPSGSCREKLQADDELVEVAIIILYNIFPYIMISEKYLLYSVG